MENQLRTLVQEHFEALEAEDMQAIENTLHPESFFLGQSLEIARQVSTTYDLTYSPGKHWIFLAQDKDYAYARIEYETRRVSRPSFADNAVDQLWAFRQYDGEWRVWSTTLLNVDYFVPPISGESYRRPSEYDSVNYVFVGTETRAVDCGAYAEFAEVAEQPGVVCGLASADRQAFYEDASAILDILEEAELLEKHRQSGAEETSVIHYFDRNEQQTFQMTFIPGGFVTVTQSEE